MAFGFAIAARLLSQNCAQKAQCGLSAVLTDLLLPVIWKPLNITLKQNIVAILLTELLECEECVECQSFIQQVERNAGRFLESQCVCAL